MAKYPIPAEALPSILQLWVWTRENLNVEFTIREAQWAARLYTVAKSMRVLSYCSRTHTLGEILYEQIGAPYESSQCASANLDLQMFGLMTGQELTPEREKKILGLSDERWLALEEGTKLRDERDDILFAYINPLGNKEAQNER